MLVCRLDKFSTPFQDFCPKTERSCKQVRVQPVSRPVHIYRGLEIADTNDHNIEGRRRSLYLPFYSITGMGLTAKPTPYH